MKGLLPIGICAFFEMGLVFVPICQRVVEILVVKQEKLSIDDLERLWVHAYLFSFLSHGIGAPSAIGRLIFGRVLFKRFLIGGRRKIPGHALPGKQIILAAFYGFALLEIS